MTNNYLIHTKNGVKIYERNEIVNNAKSQKQGGCRPHYRNRDITNYLGYLVLSTWQDGCIVVVLAADYPNLQCDLVLTGWQGDFDFVLDS